MGYTTLSAAGAKIRAKEWRDAITEVRKVSARKTVNEIVNGSATLQADDELFVPVEANRVYDMALVLFYIATATPDLKFQLTAPSGAALVWGGTYYDSVALAFASNGNFSLATVGVVGGTGGDATGTFRGTLTTGASAGNLALTWAQNTSNASNTTIYAGSELILTLLS